MLNNVECNETIVEKINIFKDGQQNSPEWTEMFIRLREKYGNIQCDPQTGLGVTYGGKLLNDNQKI